jgi:stage V sporulation protein G
MNITQVKVFPVAEEKLKAYVSIVLDDCFLVSDLKVIQGPNGLFISMPSKRKKNGEFKDVAHPLNRETRERMEKRILEEYEKVRAAAGPSAAARAPGQGAAPGAAPEPPETPAATTEPGPAAPEAGGKPDEEVAG